jgi:ribosome-binding factor A
VSGRRSQRLAEEIRETVARIIADGLNDPRIGFVTVTRASITADLRTARVYVGVLGDDFQRKKTLAGLAQAAGFIRRELGRRIRVRYTPELTFQYDSGLDATDRVAQLLEENRAADESADTSADTSADEPGDEPGDETP